jgi:signal transduction histidine kinase
VCLCSETSAPTEKKCTIGNRVFYRDLGVLALFAVLALAASVYAADVTERRDREATESRETLRALTHRLQTVREDEARRIAQELHDELGQQLTVLKMEVESIRRRIDSGRAVDEPLEEMNEMIDEAIHAVRRISSELRPGVLDRLGLTAALEWLLREFERRSSVHTELRATAVGPVDSDTATTLFRITQEALTNVARHSRATSVVAELSEAGGRIVLRIRDDGAGFDAARAGRTSLGLIGMKERVVRLGGTFEIFSAPGSGTELVATVPNTVMEEPACIAS